MNTITINPDDPASINAALNTEWLLTNGLGGYAMGTVLGVNTRRYHGLLVAATKPPVGRIVALHSMIEQLVIPREDGREEVIDLSTQQFVGGDGQPMLHPRGWRLLIQAGLGKYNSFSWTWQDSRFRMTRRLTCRPENYVRLTYHVFHCPRGSRLRLRLFTPLRDFHSLSNANAIVTQQSDQGIGLLMDGIVLRVHAMRPFSWKGDPQIWRNYMYVLDRNRGQDHTDDIWSPGFIEYEIDEDPFSTVVHVDLVVRELQIDQLPDVQSLRSEVSSCEKYQPSLTNTAKQFIVSRKLQNEWTASVIAGYPWFGDWGRDTMIALPGLMLCTGRFDEARSTLLTFARSMKNGLIPNLFDDYGGADHYNTVDASLWFVHAAHELWKSTSKSDTELLKACREIIGAYRDGTDFNIRMDPRDSLIAAGDPSTQLTWMDAKRDNIAFTPRNGKPVEINALWFNALQCFAEMTDDKSERSELIALSENVSKSFRLQFWWSEHKCLHDVLSPQGSDATRRDASFVGDHRLRPNQIFAISLPFSPLKKDQQRAVVKIVGDRLLTPFGLRTLDREDPQYRGRYEGNLFDRDSAYHQGTVWPWLIGPFCEALLRVNDFSDDAKRQASKIIQPLIDEMSNTSGGRCLNQIAEVYDGDPPHRPSGCPAQAWSVAEVLRIVTLIDSD